MSVSFVSSFTGLEGVGRRASLTRDSSSISIGFVSGSDTFGAESGSSSGVGIWATGSATILRLESEDGRTWLSCWVCVIRSSGGQVAWVGLDAEMSSVGVSS